MAKRPAQQETRLELVEGGADAAPPVEIAEIMDPLTGEVIDARDIDALLEAYGRVRSHRSCLEAFQRVLAEVITGHTTGDAKTRRIRGQRLRAKVEMPGDSWDGGLLRLAWEAHPELAPEVLKIERVGVRLREWAKWQQEAGPEDFERLKAMITKANRGPTGTPTITIEEGGA